METPAPIITHDNVLTQDEITSILNDSVAQSAFKRLELSGKQQEYFTMELSDEIKWRLGVLFGMDFSSIQRIPMRWIKGDIAAHEDKGSDKDFKKTHLLYVSECSGDFILDGRELSIQQNRAFVFDEGLIHETRNTNDTPRLLVGPMDENGNAVGAITSILLDGAAYELHISYNSGLDIYYFYGVSNTDPTAPDLSINVTSWPVTINNSNSTPSASSVLRVIFDSDITMTSSSQYFICGTEYIQFGSEALDDGGTRPTITIQDIADYPGLIFNGQNGDGLGIGTDGYSNISVYNLRVASAGTTTLAEDGGWFGQQGFGTSASDCYFINCFSDGEINASCGGIVGRLSYGVSAINCNTTGDLNDSDGGGIFGEACENCSAEGCSSTGEMSGRDFGGIFGENCVNCTATNCYYTGIISGDDTGGIFGNGCENCTTTNCYSTGIIQGSYAGGIFGGDCTDCVAVNCYSAGAITGSDAGGIFSTSGTNPTETRCYAANGVWSDGDTTTYLTGIPSSTNVGTTWVRNGAVNTPYELRIAGFSPYSLLNINGDDKEVMTDNTVTLEPGQSTSPAEVGSTFSIVEINDRAPSEYPAITINSTTGAITFGEETEAGEYDILVRCVINPYSYSNVIVTINGEEVNTANCCISLNGMKYLPAETVTNVRAGNNVVLVAQTNLKNKFTSYDAYLRYKATGMSKKRL